MRIRLLRTTAALMVALATSFAIPSQAADFVPLFNGKDLTGWTQCGGKATYTVEDGTIVGRSVPLTPNSFLCTTRNYRDFILELDFKVDPDLNSGIQFRSNAYDEPTQVSTEDGVKSKSIPPHRVHGYQFEIDNDTKRARLWTGGVYDEGRRGWLFPGIAGGAPNAFTEQGKRIIKIDDWNHVRIQAVGDSIKTHLNGELRADFKDSLTPDGFIALQVHGVGTKPSALTVRWRNIRIEEIEKSP